MSGEASSSDAQQFSSLTALKMAALAESNVTYEQLHDVEREFEDVETEIIRQQYQMSKPIYEKRQALISQIPNFWPLVLEQAPPEIDEFIQPTDSNVLLSALKSVSVSRFELDADPAKGDPRSVAIRLEFGENEFFEDKVIEKKFYYRHARDFNGLISEPLTIKWKAGKDLTEGLLDLVRKVWDEDKDAFRVLYDDAGKEKKKALSATQKELRDKLDATAMGGVSFFVWLAYVGRRISDEESAEAIRKMRAEMQARKEGKAPAEDDAAKGADEDAEMEDEDEEDDDIEPFPPGDDLAQAFVLDLWPDALKYFTQAQELEDMSDMEFETDDEDDDEEPALKKVKA